MYVFLNSFRFRIRRRRWWRFIGDNDNNIYDAILNIYYNAEKRVPADGMCFFHFPSLFVGLSFGFFRSRAFPANGERLVNKNTSDYNSDCRLQEDSDEQILNNNNNNVFSRSRITDSLVVSKHWD